MNALLRGRHGWPQRELYAVKLPGNEHTRIKIGNHSDGLEFLDEGRSRGDT